MKKLIFIFCSLLIAIFISSESAQANSGLADSPWPVFHGNSKLTGQSPYDTSKVDGTVKWRINLPGGVETSPVIASDGTVYIADHTCNLYAIDPKNGKEKWHFDAGEPVTSKEWGGSSCFQASPTVATDGIIYIAPMTGYLFAIDQNGKEKWKYPVFNFKNNWSSPSVGPDGTVYVGSETYPPPETAKPEEKSGIIYAINPDGTLKWQYDTGGNWSTSTASIADDGTIYMSGNDGFDQTKNKLFALDGQTGKVKWKFDHGGVMESSASIGSDGTIYFGVKGKNNPRQGAKLYALTPEGKEKWSLEMPCGNSITPAIATNGTLYFGDWDGTFYAIDPSGKIIWKVETTKSFETLSSSPSLGSDGTIYFGSLANYFYAYTPDGQEKWKFKVKNGINSSPAIGSDGTIYVGQTGGELIAFGSKKANSTKNIKTLSETKSKNNISINKSKAKNSPIVKTIFIASITLLSLLTIGLIIYLKKRGVAKRVWSVLILPILAIAILLIMTPRPKDDHENIQWVKDSVKNNSSNNDTQVENSLEKMFDYGEKFDKICPEQIKVERNRYLATTKDKTWEIPNMRQIDWISESCPDTIWPDGQAKIYSEN